MATLECCCRSTFWTAHSVLHCLRLVTSFQFENRYCTPHCNSSLGSPLALASPPRDALSLPLLWCSFQFFSSLLPLWSLALRTSSTKRSAYRSNRSMTFRGLTPRSTRTQPALPTSMSHGSESPSPLTIRPPVGPVNFFR